MIPFENFIESFPEALLVVALDGKVELANTEAARAFGVSLRELQGKHLRHLINESDEELAGMMRLWSRSTGTAPGTFHLSHRSDDEGAPGVLRIDGARMVSVEEPRLLLRCRNHEASTARFRALTEQVTALSEEVGRRTRAEQAVEW